MAKLWGVDADDEGKMLGVQVIANGLVNIDLIARALGARRETPVAASVDGEDGEDSGG